MHKQICLNLQKKKFFCFKIHNISTETDTFVVTSTFRYVFIFLCFTLFSKSFLLSSLAYISLLFFSPPRLRAGLWRVASSDELQRLARAEADLHRAFRLKDPDRLVEDFWWNWCLRHTCVVFWPGELTPSQPRKMLFHEELQRRRVPPTGSDSVSDPCRALPHFWSCCGWTHGRGPAGIRLYFSRDRQDVVSWGCRVLCCQGQTIKKIKEIDVLCKLHKTTDKCRACLSNLIRFSNHVYKSQESKESEGSVYFLLKETEKDQILHLIHLYLFFKAEQLTKSLSLILVELCILGFSFD